MLFRQRPEGGHGCLIFTGLLLVGVPGFVLSRAINAAITRSMIFFHSEYQG